MKKIFREQKLGEKIELKRAGNKTFEEVLEIVKLIREETIKLNRDRANFNL